MSVEEAVKKVQQLYKGLGWPSYFSRLKFYAAPFKETAMHIPEEGVIIDLGCGYGVFSNMLGLLSGKRQVIGLDFDESKVKFANRGLTNVFCASGDITRKEIPVADSIVLVHVLHHLKSYEEQEKLLKVCFNKLKPGGRLVVTEVGERPRWKFFLCSLADRVLYPKDIINFREEKDFVDLFNSLGFSTKVIPMHKGALFSHVTYLCEKV